MAEKKNPRTNQTVAQCGWQYPSNYQHHLKAKFIFTSTIVLLYKRQSDLLVLKSLRSKESRPDVSLRENTGKHREREHRLYKIYLR